MIAATNGTVVPEPRSRSDDLVTFKEFQNILKIFLVAIAALSLAGVFTNAVNLVIFARMGLKESVNICLFWLSFTDFFISVLALHNAVVGALVIVEMEHSLFFSIAPVSLAKYGSKIREVLYNASLLTTTYLAVARCCCVAFPFHFRGMFTRFRTCVVLVLMSVVAVGSYAYFFYVMRPVFVRHAATNRTQLKVFNTAELQSAANVSYVINDILLTPVPQVIVTVCVIVMANKLRKSLKFRQTSTATRREAASVPDREPPPSSTGSVHRRNDEGRDSGPVSGVKNVTKPLSSKEFGNKDLNTKELSAKEVQVITQVTLICTIFILCNVPKILSRILNIYLMDLRQGGRYQMTFQLILSGRMVIELVGVVVNILVYYRFNTKFRARFMGMFGLQSPEGTNAESETKTKN